LHTNLTYNTFPPPPSLAGYVRSFWHLEGKLADGQPYTHRTMADGCAEMVFHYKGPFREITAAGTIETSFLAGFHGQTAHHRRFVTDTDFGIFGVYLYPYALPDLFKIPATAISNQMPGLFELFGQEGRDVEEQVMLAHTTQQRIDIICRLLQKQLGQTSRPQPGVFNAISHIIHSKGLVRVDELAGKHFLSLRQFERKFKECSGFSPKLFSRIIRFQQALHQYHNKHISLTQIAYECGYYDQSHFIHDFKSFSGHHPKQFFVHHAEGAPVWME
jgi:AraC-like DNA-binding protein